MSTLWIHPLVIYQLLFLLVTISSQSSYYVVQCNNASLNNNATLIDTNTSPITLSKIPIPIQKSNSNLTCLLRIYLSSTYNFQQDSKCSISFDMTETQSLSPTQAPILIPTIEPTTEPTTNPTSIPTSIPTLEPTIESTIIDLDELVLSNIFSVNDQNIFWQTFYQNGTSSVHIFPSCVNDEISTNDTTTFATEDVFAESTDVDALITVLKGVALDDEYGSETFSINSSTADITPLFPISFNISTYDTMESSSFKYSQFDTNSFKCYYKDAFSINNTAQDSYINAIDYYLVVTDPFGKTIRDHIVIDVIINTICVADTEPPTNMPTTVPTITFPDAFTTMSDDDDDDEDEDNFLGLGVSIEIFIAIIVVAAIILLSSILVGICLCKRKSIWEDDEDDEATIMIKPPKTHKETELVTNKFMVTEDDHAEMIELAKRNSLSTGLQI
eukprot:21939_1